MSNGAKYDPLPGVMRTIDEKGPDAGSLWMHIRSGATYEVVACAIEEETLRPVVVYQQAGKVGDGPNPVWTRPLDAFMDGRFTKVPA